MTSVHRDRTYRFVDFAAAKQPGFRNHLVPVAQVAALVDRYAAEECYASIFFFSDDALLYLHEHRVAGRPSIAGYDGRIWAPFLPLDVDGQEEGGLDESLRLTRMVYESLVQRWTCPPAALHVYFSGAKGFHILVDTRVFGRVMPSRHLHRVFSRLRLLILRWLPDETRPLLDLSIGDKTRLLRLPNTRHGRSGLYKIALEPTELASAAAANIRSLATRPRTLTRVDCAGLMPVAPVQAVAGAQAAYRAARNAVRRARGPHPYRLQRPAGQPENVLCPARRIMWESQVRAGERNNVAIRLASAFRLGGYGREETAALLLGWNRERRIGLPEREVLTVVRSAYARPYPYNYGCHDEVIHSYCPYVGRWNECDDYRHQHPRSGRGL